LAPLFFSNSTKLSEDHVWQPSKDYGVQLQAKQQGYMVELWSLRIKEARTRV